MDIDAATQIVRFKSPDKTKEVLVIASQVFAITQIANGTTCLVGPQNAVMFVDVSIDEAKEKILAAIKLANQKEASNGI